MSEPVAPSSTRPLTHRRLLLLAAMIGALAVVLFSGVTDYLTLGALNANREKLLALVAENRPMAIAIFAAAYFAGVALSVPAFGLVTLVGGFLFGPVLGTILVLISATLGGTVVFLTARYVLGDVLRARAPPLVRKIEADFTENGLSYLIALRLMQVIPFFLVNWAMALTAMPMRTFILGTFLGIIPGTTIYATVGAGLGDALAAGVSDPLEAVRQPTVIGGLAGLVVLALLPVIYNRFRKRG